jgi:hypothetical protein
MIALSADAVNENEAAVSANGQADSAFAVQLRFACGL